MNLRDVYILGNGTTNSLFADWRHLYENFNVKWIANPVPPPPEWYEVTTMLSRPNSIELYNQLQIWQTIIEDNRPAIILYNRSIPLQPPNVITNIFNSLFSTYEAERTYDTVLLGYYNEYCHLIHAESSLEQFNLKKPVEAQGAFAYFVTVSSAQRMMNRMVLVTEPVDEIVPKVGNVMIMYPPIARYGEDLDDPIPQDRKIICKDNLNESIELDINTFVLQFFLVLAAGLALGAFFFIIYACIKDKGDDKVCDKLVCEIHKPKEEYKELSDKIEGINRGIYEETRKV